MYRQLLRTTKNLIEYDFIQHQMYECAPKQEQMQLNSYLTWWQTDFYASVAWKIWLEIDLDLVINFSLTTFLTQWWVIDYMLKVYFSFSL